MMDGDLEERSMDQIQMQMVQGNVLPLSMRKTVSEVLDAHTVAVNRLRNATARLHNASPEQISEEIDHDEQIDFALSNSPYHVKSGGMGSLGQSQDANSVGGTVYNFGYNSA